MWNLRLLGEISLSLAPEGNPLAGADPPRRLRARKYALLLAYLALYPERAHRRDELAELFWSDSDTEAGRVCLRTALSSLRRVLRTGNPLAPAEPFVADGQDTLRLHPHLLTCDAVMFERLLKRASAPNRTPAERCVLREKALSLYKGPLLPGSDEPWILGERERLENLLQRATLQQKEMPALRFQNVPDHREAMETPGSHIVLATLSIPLLLPAPASKYFGRERERVQIDDWFTQGARFITITGIGGIGKTRLALEAARTMAGKRRWGHVAFVPLATCTEANLLPETVLSVLAPHQRSKERPWDDPAMEELLSLLCEPSTPGLPIRRLLILDNMEQLLTGEENGGAVRFVQALLTSVPHLSLLVTSRTPLRAEGEHELPITGLSQKDGAALLLDRARMAGRPDWGSATDALLPKIGTLLDGIPLAIELVASWANVLSPRQLGERLLVQADSVLDSPFTTDRRGLWEPARHRSLRTALEWGYADLPPETRRFFGGLASVFRGGATLTSATAVLSNGDEMSALFHLATLRDRSLIFVTEDNEDTRYQMLQIVKEWATERFAPDSELLPHFQRRHAEFFLSLTDTEATRVGGPEAALGFARLESDEANILAAFEYAALGDSLPAALDLMRRMRWCWFVRGRQMARTTARRLLQTVWETKNQSLQQSNPEQYADLAETVAPLLPESEAIKILSDVMAFYEKRCEWKRTAGICEQFATRADTTHDPNSTDAWMARAVSYQEKLDDNDGLGILLANWAGACTRRGDFDKAYPLLLRSYELARSLGVRGHSGAAKIALALAGDALRRGAEHEAESFIREAIPFFVERGETWNHADALKTLGLVIATQAGRQAEAKSLWEQSCDLFLQAGDPDNAKTVSSYFDN